MSTLEIAINPRYEEMSVPGVLAKGLRERIRHSVSPRERVGITFPHEKVSLPKDTVLAVRFARKEEIVGYSPAEYAAYLGAWLHEALDGRLRKKQIVVTVIIGREARGVWKRHP